MCLNFAITKKPLSVPPIPDVENILVFCIQWCYDEACTWTRHTVVGYVTHIKACILFILLDWIIYLCCVVLQSVVIV